VAAIINANLELLQDTANILSAGQWAGAGIHLTKSEVGPSPTTLLADLLAAEATFTGYSPIFGGLAAAGYFATSVYAYFPAFWQALDAADPNEIYDFFITDSTNTILLGLGQLDQSPWPMLQAGDSLVLSLFLTLLAGVANTLPSGV